MEQFDLNFDRPKQPEEMTLEELVAEYKTKVGVPPRTSDTTELIAALNNPEDERSRLREEDAEADKDDLARPFRGAR